MSMFGFLGSLLALLKEFVYGRKIRDDEAGKPGMFSKLNLSTVVDLFQRSRRVAIVIVLLLMLSMFVNYKTISKLRAVQAPREDQTDVSPADGAGRPKEVSTGPANLAQQEQPQPSSPPRKQKDNAAASDLLMQIYGK